MKDERRAERSFPEHEPNEGTYRAIGLVLEDVRVHQREGIQALGRRQLPQIHHDPHPVLDFLPEEETV